MLEILDLIKVGRVVSTIILGVKARYDLLLMLLTLWIEHRFRKCEVSLLIVLLWSFFESAARIADACNGMVLVMMVMILMLIVAPYLRKVAMR